MVKKQIKTKNRHSNKKDKKHTTHKSKHNKYEENNDSNIDYDFDLEDANIMEDDQYDSNQEYEEEEDDEEEVSVKQNKLQLATKTRERLKNKINSWLDYDDKIKELNVKTKKYKDAKKTQEDVIITMITKLGMEDNKIDVHDDSDNLRGRVYRHKSVTKGTLKEDIIKDALMEAIRDEKKVDQLVKKIESKRPINERYYLKRTKGTKDD